MNIGTIAIDLIVLGILLFTCFKAYKNGLLLTLYQIISIFLAIWIAWAINPIVKTTLIEHTSIVEFLDKNIKDGITKSISNSLFTGESTSESEDAVSKLNVPKFVKDYLAKSSMEDKTQNSLATFLTDKITDICLTIISFLLVIVIVTIILSLLKGLIKMISEIPVIEQVDKLTGILFGIMLGAIKVWVIFLIVGLFIKPGSDGTLFKYITGSYLGNWFYNNNLISYIILKILG